MALSPPTPIVETQPKVKAITRDPASSIRIIPLGGVGEFGQNMMCYEFGEERIVVDCGSMAPESDMLGIDLVIPDISYLLDEPERVKAFVLTHGHEDHIGALPYVLPKLTAPIYGTKLTLALLEAKLEEQEMGVKADLRELKLRERVQIGKNFQIQPIHVTHAIPDSVALAIHTPAGTIIHTGDYKIDYSPMDGQAFDFYSLAQLGEEGVLALVADSTNAERPGTTQTEAWVEKHLEPIFASSTHTILCSTFASSFHRLQLLLDLAEKFGRRIFIAGRRLERNFAIATELGHITIPYQNICALKDINAYPRNERLIIATGCQGEPLATMARVALGEHKLLQVEEGDTIILSSRIIPGNERTIYRMMNHFCRHGARVFDPDTAKVHASGHAYREEMKTLISLTRPRFLIPVHGEFRQLKAHAELAQEMGFNSDSIKILSNGDVLEMHSRSATVTATVPTGHTLVDGKTVGETAEVVLRDRQHLSEDGMLIAILNVDRKTRELIMEPEIVTRGFVYVEESETLIQALREISRDAFHKCAPEAREEAEIVYTEVRRALRRYIRKNFDRYPLIIPVVQEI